MDTVFTVAAVAAVFVISGGSVALYVILHSEKQTGDATRAGIVNLHSSSHES